MTVFLWVKVSFSILKVDFRTPHHPHLLKPSVYWGLSTSVSQTQIVSEREVPGKGVFFNKFLYFRIFDTAQISMLEIARKYLWFTEFMRSMRPKVNMQEWSTPHTTVKNSPSGALQLSFDKPEIWIRKFPSPWATADIIFVQAYAMLLEEQITSTILTPICLWARASS